MFRNPRENAHPALASPGSISESHIVAPSIGRPPTPPKFDPSLASARSARLSSSSSSTPPVKMSSSSPTLSRTRSSMSSNGTPLGAKAQTKLNLGAMTTNGSANGNGIGGRKGSAKKGKGDGSILAFFKKVDVDGDVSVGDEMGLFVGGGEVSRRDHDENRFNEDEGSVKRRRTGSGSGTETENGVATGELKLHAVAPGGPPEGHLGNTSMAGDGAMKLHAVAPGGPPEGRSGETSVLADGSNGDGEKSKRGSKSRGRRAGPFVEETDSEEEGEAMVPTLKREETSAFRPDTDEAVEEFGDDEFADGEEFLERKWMEEEQRRMENDFDNDEVEPIKEEASLCEFGLADSATTCPICNAGLGGISDADAQLHVNHCLDGNPIPLPERRLVAKPAVDMKAVSSANRFQRPARPAKPGQANPFEATTGSSSSAFSKLMSSHAEDAAWATAAAAENRARGRPAYERTCPFYKILPGMKICVDAFRYGAVEGCEAYFLSHFHSDHYVGLTSTWQHGPIYCSHVTANLVRQQLRVDPKYVVDLEFEQKVEVPRTPGVAVTMIPANHCPGSSLFLYEKVIGRGKNPKVQRVLHCGDFRACPEHLNHPLLRPELIDSVSGKHVGPQKIDVCYLDTTYLNPRYAFPPQEEVIRACADMCVSLRKDRADETDAWETMKRDRAGTGMAKFMQTDTNGPDTPLVKAEGDQTSFTTTTTTKPRGRLLVVVGTYSIGKERICLGIAQALNSLIYAPPGKRRICACLEDPVLSALLTSDPLAAQVHMTPLFEIRAETLADYLNAYRPHFSRVVGFRPSGWNYKPPTGRFTDSPAVQTVLYGDNWKSRYRMDDLVAQRGSGREAKCFGVPYSEHSSFRELSMFCCALRIEKVIPTVNVGSQKGREKMKAWVDRWATEKKKNGLFKLTEQGEGKGVW